MTKKEILTQMFEKGQPFYNEIDILDAMDVYLIQELKELLEECKSVHPEYIVEKIKSQIDYLEMAFSIDHNGQKYTQKRI